jgi:hypothetical protein
MFEAPKDLVDLNAGETEAGPLSGPMSLSERWRYLGSTKFDKPRRQSHSLAELLPAAPEETES